MSTKNLEMPITREMQQSVIEGIENGEKGFPEGGIKKALILMTELAKERTE
jgi:hypothetical protein